MRSSPRALFLSSIVAGAMAMSLATNARADDDPPAINAGLIIYKLNPDGSLDGRWTLPDMNGANGTEHAMGGTPGKFEGRYKVETFDQDNKSIFQGSLEIKQIGVAYTLIWTSTSDPSTGAQSKFVGIGLVENDSILASDFQEGGPSGK